MTSWAPTVSRIRDNGFGSSRGGANIEGAIIHHDAGLDAEDYVANSNDRNSHPTYHINRKGEAAGIVNPARRPSSTAHGVDQIAITFELANESVGGEWPIGNPTLETLIQTLLWHESQSARRGFVRNQRGVEQGGFFIGYHAQYVSTACPGKFMIDRIDWLVGELNRRKAAGEGGIPPMQVPPIKTQPAAVVQPKPTGNVVGPVLASGSDWAYRRPAGELAKRVVRALQGKGRLDSGYPNDGDPQAVFDKAVQRTLNYSNIFNGLEDGDIRRGGTYGVQDYAIAFGDYTKSGGRRDGRPEGLSWSCFALGLERP